MHSSMLCMALATLFVVFISSSESMYLPSMTPKTPRELGTKESESDESNEQRSTPSMVPRVVETELITDMMTHMGNTPMWVTLPTPSPKHRRGLDHDDSSSPHMVTRGWNDENVHESSTPEMAPRGWNDEHDHQSSTPLMVPRGFPYHGLDHESSTPEMIPRGFAYGMDRESSTPEMVPRGWNDERDHESSTPSMMPRGFPYRGMDHESSTPDMVPRGWNDERDHESSTPNMVPRGFAYGDDLMSSTPMGLGSDSGFHSRAFDIDNTGTSSRDKDLVNRPTPNMPYNVQEPRMVNAPWFVAGSHSTPSNLPQDWHATPRGSMQ